LPCSPHFVGAANALEEVFVEVLLDTVGDRMKVLEYIGTEVESTYVLPGVLLAIVGDEVKAVEEALELKLVEVLGFRELRPPEAEFEAVELKTADDEY
jgi:hypothetical protein